MQKSALPWWEQHNVLSYMLISIPAAPLWRARLVHKEGYYCLAVCTTTL